MTDKKGGYLISFVTARGEEEAERIAELVVSEGLAACCNIVAGVKSIYTWKGEVCKEGEVLCIFKTRRDLFERFMERVIALHSYEVPEVIAVNIEAGSQKYLDWIDEVMGKG
ncbi:MAG: divalent-cation tolerance protein CutA [Thermodesulfobacteriota bacterium]